MENISWVDKISNEEVLQRISQTKAMLDTMENTSTWLGRVLRHESLLHDMIQGIMNGKATQGRKRMHLLSDLMKGKYVALKRTAAEDRKEWWKLLRAGSHTPASQQIT